MEVDFDKEIDALLRKARHDGPVLVGDVVAPHLEADELAAFAEDALPGKTRALYMKHLADCDRCRKLLSNLLVLNSEEAPALAAASAPGVITIAERDLPWYRKLFLFPNLAYVMGGLVLVLGGFLAFTIVQRSGLNEGAMVSQAPETQNQERGPSFQFEPSFDGAANSSANAVAGTSTSTLANSNTGAAPMPTPALGDAAVSGPRDNNFVMDGTATGSGAVAAVPPPPPAAAAEAQPSRKDAEADDVRVEDKEKALAKPDVVKNEPSAKQQYSMPSQSGPMRNNESQYNRQLENMDRRAAARAAAPRDEDGSRRTVGGRTFERKQSVWYDVTYQGRPTINVRRGSSEFNKLDGGLRSIANQLSGTIVVVWGAKAYRIN